MKKIIFLLFLLLSITQISYSQNPGTGWRIKLLKNLHQHYTPWGYSYSALWGYTAPNGREYALLGCFTGTAIIDITDTNNIREVDFVSAPDTTSPMNEWREIKTYSHYAYVVSEAGGGFQIIDLQYLPDSVRYVGRVGSFAGHTISQSGPYLYVNGGSYNGFGIFDLTVNPENPVTRGTWLQEYVHDSRIINDTLWGCNAYINKVTVVDVRNKNNPVTGPSWTNNPQPNSPHNIALTNNRQYALITDETFVPSPGRLKIWNVSDLSNPIYLTSFNPTPFEKADVHNVEIYNNNAFLAYYTAGVKILNISNPANPVEIGWYDTYPENNGSFYDGCWGVYYFPASNKIIASDRSRGLFVLKPDLSTPVSGLPKANLMPSNFEINKRDSIQLIDASDGIPANWSWTITGPENKTSTTKNPTLSFTGVGQYTVKLRVSNSFGSDSITKVNSFRVKSLPMTAFQITSPVGNPFFNIHTTYNDTSKIIFTWRRAGDVSDVKYKLNFRKTASLERYISSNNNGADSFYVMNKSYLDSMAVQFGLTGDSVLFTFRIRAYNETDSITSINSTPIIVHTNTVGIENISDIIPDKYSLYQNYPNPFNPETNIKFDLPKNGYVDLILYDITGREISKLVEQNLEAGRYNYKFNASNFNSGVYFIRLISNDFSETRKIVLVK